MRKVLGKVPTFAIWIVTLVLVAAIVVLFEWKLIKPQKEELAKLQEELAAEEAVAAERPQAEARLAEVQAKWEEAQARLQQLQDTRSFPISTYQPIGAMVALWFEYREDLPRVTREWLESTGITLESGITFPTPEVSPPTIPSSGFIALPGPMNLTIGGTLQQIERFYSSLGTYSRVATISGLQLTGEGDNLKASVPISLYLLVETPAAAPAAPAAGPGPAPGPEGAAPPEPGPPTPPGTEGGGEEAGGGADE